MHKGNAAELAVAVYDILNRMSDEQHLISMPSLQALLNEEGIEANRQTVYKAISILNDHGFDISFHKERGIQGYCIAHPLTQTEAFVLINAVQESASLSKKASAELIERIKGLISEPSADALPETLPAAGKRDDDGIMQSITLLIKAVSEHKPVEFLYYDITVTKQKKYRRNSRIYHMIPYAVIARSGLYYCIFYSEEHQSFANYRIDKLDHLAILEEEESVHVRFSLEEHIRSSFEMFTGDAETVTIRFSSDLANAVFDRFGTEIIISEAGNDWFTANIRTAVTPTLISWLLQFYDRCCVLRPQSLIDRLLLISDAIAKTYRGDNNDE